jgi:tetratricopeptide (TPR) repeat protein
MQSNLRVHARSFGSERYDRSAVNADAAASSRRAGEGRGGTAGAGIAGGVHVKRHAPLSIVLLLAGFALYLGLWRRPDSVGPKPVPMGKTVTQLLPDARRKLRPWKITKSEVPRDKLPDLVLPKPAPRTTRENARTDSARALDAQALESWKRGDIQGALDDFDAAVKADPDAPEPHSDYGRLLTLMTDYQHAMPHLEKAAQLRPEDPQVWLDLATFYERNELFERASDAKQKAEQLAGERKVTRNDNGFWILEGTTFP